MAIRDVLRMGDPSLLNVAQAVKMFDTPILHELITDLFDTMAARQGAGIAAPQIGVGLRVVIFGIENNPRYPDAEPVPTTILINPTIYVLSDEVGEDWEGCLSVPDMRGWVPRYEHIRYSGFNQFGKPFVRDVTGFHARVVQHECDHLEGILYPQRIKDLRKFGFREEVIAAEDT